MCVLRLFAITPQPSGIMGTYTYRHGGGDKEKPLKIVLGLIYRFQHYKNANVAKIGDLVLIQWWYL